MVWLFDYWSSLLDGRNLPSRDDIDPVLIPSHILQWVIMTDIIADDSQPRGHAFRYRLMSARHVEITGRELTGTYVHEVTSNQAYNAYVIDLYHDVMEAKRPVYSESEWRNGQTVTRRNQRLMMPLSDNGRDVNMVFTGQLLAYGDKGQYTEKVDHQEFNGTVKTVL